MCSTHSGGNFPSIFFLDYGNNLGGVQFSFSPNKYRKWRRYLTPKVKVGGWHVGGSRPLIVLCVLALKGT